MQIFTHFEDSESIILIILNIFSIFAPLQKVFQLKIDLKFPKFIKFYFDSQEKSGKD